MRIRRTYLTALATAPAAAAAIFAAVIASPPHVQLSSAPIHNAPLDGDLNIPGVPGNIDFDVPDVNVPDIIDIPHVDVPNINLPNINPGHVGRPGRGR